MSSSNKMKEVVVLCPNGRRVNIKTNSSTSIGQIIEEACLKHGFDPYIYNLKFLHRTLDPSSTLHYSNIPNHAQLEVIKALGRRQEGSVTVNLVTEKGQRLIVDFPSPTSLWDILVYHESQPDSNIHIPAASSGFQPFIVYTMRRIVGEDLKTSTLKSLGLFSGKCMMRYNVQKVEAIESSPIVIVSPKTIAKPSRTAPETSESWNESNRVDEPLAEKETSEKAITERETSGKAITERETSGKAITERETSEKAIPETKDSAVIEKMDCDSVDQEDPVLHLPDATMATKQPETETNSLIMKDIQKQTVEESCHKNNSITEKREPYHRQHYPRAEKSPPKIIPLSDHNSVLFNMDDVPSTANAHENDDFFELTLKEVRSLHRDRVKQLKEMEEAPIMTSSMRQLEKDSRMLSAMNRHPVTHLRICFPDRHVIQANFKPHNTIRDVMDFLSPLLIRRDLKFYLYTIFPREVLEPGLSLVEAGCIPNARLYFGSEEDEISFLSRETLAKKSSFEAAANSVITSNPKSILSQESEVSPPLSTEAPQPSTSSHPVERSSGAVSKTTTGSQGVPKWFKLGK